jgi:hypothetical protein
MRGSKNDFSYTKAWTTHLPMLIKTVQATNGSVAEFGVGLSSTPLLHWLCFEKRQLVSYESDIFWYEFAKKFQSRNHSIRLVEDWDKVDTTQQWSVIFIDHLENRRVTDIIRFKDSADYIVIHDTDDTKHYGWDKVWSNFKYIHHWKGCSPWTSVVSNKKDLSWLETSVL